MPFPPVSNWTRSSNKVRQNEIWLERLCLTGLLMAALILFLANLADLPLLDPQEGIFAQVAKEIYQSQTNLERLFPQLGGLPYLETPPLMQNVVAIAYSIAGVSELTTRFPGAFLGALSVLLLYQIGREVFVARLPALFSALVYLTCIPIVRYSRLATLDGPLLFFQLLSIWVILLSRRDSRWALAAGASFSLMSLTKGLTSIQFLTIALLFLLWDTPRLLSSWRFWQGICLGIFPGLSWYVGQWFYLKQYNLEHHLPNIFLSQIGSLDPSFPELIKDNWLHSLQYFVPWIVILLGGVQLIKHNLHWSWSKLLAVWLGGYFILDILILHQSYWLIIPLYPALALLAGKELDRVCNLPTQEKYPKAWLIGFTALAAISALVGLYYGPAKLHRFLSTIYLWIAMHNFRRDRSCNLSA